MKKIAFLFLAGFFLLTSCFEDYDDNIVYSNSEVKDFIWKSLNAVYIYKDNVNDLLDTRFETTQDYKDYLDNYNTPQELFNNLIYQPNETDRFSKLFSDYRSIEQLLEGATLSNGMVFGLELQPNSDTKLYGIVFMVLNNSVAENKGVIRGQLFSKIDNIELTVDNYKQLLTQDSYTLGLANYQDNNTPTDVSDDSIELTNQTISLNQETYYENPVYLTKIIDLGNTQKLGYLMYNGFYSNYNNQLNDAFSFFKNNNVTHLVLDLRYNGGGSVQTATYLGSMVTGQFTGQVFAKTFYNNNLAANDKEYLFTENLNTGNSINQLNLNNVYVITTSSTASASEMIINSLKEYINVIQVGETTTGKSQISSIVYDSPSLFSKENVNLNHNYAMLPLIGISVNANDGQVPSSGIVPSIQLTEDYLNLGELGNPTEPLLAAIIDNILGTSRLSNSTIKITTKTKPFKYFNANRSTHLTP